MREPGSPAISVVVCSHNGGACLPAALTSIRRQSIDPALVQLIVVDDGSDDDTAAIGADLGAHVLVLERNLGLAAARNAGVAAARAPIVAFTDDDCVCDETWLEALLARFDDPRVDAVGGRVRPDGPESFNLRYLRRRNPLEPLGGVLLASPKRLQRLSLYLRGIVLGPVPPSAGEELYSLVGANMAFRRQLVYELGGFDEAFRFGGEEEDLCRRAHAEQRGRRIVFEPRAGVAHLFAPQIRDTLRRARAYGRGNARLAAKHADAQPIIFPIPLGVVSLGAVLLLARRPRLAALAVLAPLLSYPRWILEASSARSIEPMSYPYVQLAQEILTMRGEIEGWSAGYRPQPASQLAG